jgi:3'-5' exoribonuclease
MEREDRQRPVASAPFAPLPVTPDEIPGHSSPPGSPPWPLPETVLAPACAELHAPSGTTVRLTALVQDVDARWGDNPHTILTFSNAAGRLKSAPIWAGDQHRIPEVRKGQAVEVTGQITLWRDRRQLQLHSLRLLAADQVPPNTLHPSIANTHSWWQLLDSWRQGLRPSLARVVGLFFDDPDFRRRFEQCPASLNTHHARIGGLLQHTSEVARMALSVTELFPVVDRDVVLAGALLHDIGKLEAYHWEGLWDTTREGRIIGHVVLGARLLDRVTRQAQLGSSEELEALHHLVLSHHGHLEFGAPVLPLSIEAEILSHADLVSARTSSFADALARPGMFRPGEAFSVNSIWELDQRRIWRLTSLRG